MWSSSDCTFLFCPSGLRKTLPPAHPHLSQADKSLGPKCMRDTWKSSSAELLMEILGHSMYLFRFLNQWLYFTTWDILCNGGNRIPLSLEVGGGRRLKTVVSRSSLHFSRQNYFHFSCASCKGNVFRYIAYQMSVYKQGKVGERSCYPELAAFFVRLSVIEKIWTQPLCTSTLLFRALLRFTRKGFLL